MGFALDNAGAVANDKVFMMAFFFFLLIQSVNSPRIPGQISPKISTNQGSSQETALREEH